MTLILDLPEDLEARLIAVARANGTDQAEAARHVLESALPRLEDLLPVDRASDVDAEGGRFSVKRTSARGEFAYVPTSSAEFARRKQEEIRKEETGW